MSSPKIKATTIEIMLSTYMVSEKAPMAKPITNGAEARDHIEVYNRYARRIPAGSVGLPFHLTLDPNDLVRAFPNKKVT